MAGQEGTGRVGGVPWVQPITVAGESGPASRLVASGGGPALGRGYDASRWFSGSGGHPFLRGGSGRRDRDRLEIVRRRKCVPLRFFLAAWRFRPRENRGVGLVLPQQSDVLSFRNPL